MGKTPNYSTSGVAPGKQVAKPEGEVDMVRLPLVQYDEDEARGTAWRYNHTYTY